MLSNHTCMYLGFFFPISSPGTLFWKMAPGALFRKYKFDFFCLLPNMCQNSMYLCKFIHDYLSVNWFEIEISVLKFQTRFKLFYTLLQLYRSNIGNYQPGRWNAFGIRNSSPWGLSRSLMRHYCDGLVIRKLGCYKLPEFVYRPILIVPHWVLQKIFSE